MLSFVYSDFADSSEFSLLGAAAVTEDHILRVAPSTDGTGAAWQGEQQFVSLGFETTFQFRMGGKFESRNGMAFVIQNVSPTAIGGSIGGLGYSGLPNSLAIEFDTDSNWTLEDPSDSHISVHTRGVDPNSKKEFYSLGSISTSGYTLNDGNVHTAKLIYLPGQLSVFVDDMNTPQLSVPLDLASTMELNRGQAWVGFTAASLSTKGQNHDVLSWSYESPADATAVITVGDSGQRESVSGQTMMEFPVLVTRPDTSGPLTVEVLYSTTNGTATTPGDFVAVSDSLTIELADGQADAPRPSLCRSTQTSRLRIPRRSSSISLIP